MAQSSHSNTLWVQSEVQLVSSSSPEQSISRSDLWLLRDIGYPTENLLIMRNMHNYTDPVMHHFEAAAAAPDKRLFAFKARVTRADLGERCDSEH